MGGAFTSWLAILMIKVWHDRAWSDYLMWQERDKKTLRRINRLIRDIERAGVNGVPPAKAEILKYSTNGLRSVRIDHANRLVYGFDDDKLIIVSCRGHYE